MRIAFVSGNREKLPDAVIPMGILSVMASLPDCHERRLIDLCFERYPLRALAEEIEAFRPELIALGMRNIQTADYSGHFDQLAWYGEIIAALRAVSAAPVVLGGAGFSVMPAELMRRLRPDYGIAGEGERAFPALVERLSEPGSAIRGLYGFEGDDLVEPPPVADFLDMGGLAPIDRSLVDPRYYERYGIDSVQTKRGCPLRCDYCTYPKIEGRVGRLRDPEAVADEMMRALAEQPLIRHFFIVDSVFNLPRSHAKEVCRALIARDWQTPWTCYANPLGFDREMAVLAARAGCVGMEVGSDSGCDDVLERLNKGFTTQQIRAVHELCAAEGLPDCQTFILGTEGESMDEVNRSLDFIVDLDPYAAILMLWVDDYEALAPPLRARRLQLREEILEVLDARRADFPHWIIPPLGVNFDRGLFRRMRRRGFHGPLWQHIRGASSNPEMRGGRAVRGAERGEAPPESDLHG